MKVFIGYSKKFKENLAWVVEKNEEDQRNRLENERKKRNAEEKIKEEQRLKAVEEKRRENQFVSRFEFDFQRSKKVIVERPDLKQDILRERQEIDKSKDRVLNGQDTVDQQIKIASDLLRDLERVIIEQDLRSR